jgi:hypothetical protein
MARSPAEIQAEIRLTRRAIEARLDAIEHQTSYRRWAPYALMGVAVVGGLALSRLPVLRLLTVGTRVLAGALTLLQVVDAVRKLGERRTGAPARPSGDGAARVSTDGLAWPSPRR